ncbi:hypothetical protein MFLO_15860 [Listeria floridensis FSL S10-1187]|uniref:Uncharacterized protein n=1 Tax=Listeria floridensis FSL S10-1187 TaxID=1265817 RepID=A0ABN0RB69_9LIST|nr:hypothetical protein [Listeria floridensis]EUJ23490.1 hypothetical protein MFLO_15860 [Listeria floridensis FSL S10-1187]
MNKLPVELVIYLLICQKRGFMLEDSMAQLVKAADGDDYYLVDILSKDENFFKEDFANDIQKLAEKWGSSELLKLYHELKNTEKMAEMEE